jgi:hypothetical protein
MNEFLVVAQASIGKMRLRQSRCSGVGCKNNIGTIRIGGEKGKKKEILVVDFQIEKTKIIMESDYL